MDGLLVAFVAFPSADAEGILFVFAMDPGAEDGAPCNELADVGAPTAPAAADPGIVVESFAMFSSARGEAVLRFPDEVPDSLPESAFRLDVSFCKTSCFC